MHENCLINGKKVSPSIIVIFGASGDLAKRKLLPSLYNLYKNCFFPENFKIVGFARSKMDRVQYIDSLKEFYIYGKDEACPFLDHIEYFQGDYENEKSYEDLKKYLNELDKQILAKGNKLFYLSTPPSLMKPIVSSLSAHGLVHRKPKGGHYERVVLEKPFGHNHETAHNLNEFLKSMLAEEQIYRIDHYLGKETVQNILMFRFSNTFLEPIFNSKYIDHVQITVSEKLGVEKRGGYFDKIGILRDMIQNHLFQLLALVAMEPPAKFTSRFIHAEKVKLFSAVRKQSESELAENTFRAQYVSGVIDDKKVPSYREEDGVTTDSKTETYATMKLFIDNWRWAGVPFYLRSGKRLSKKKTEIVISLKKLPISLFNDTNIKDVSNNTIIIRIQPQEGISLCMNSKKPGYDLTLKDVDMEFSYERSFNDHIISDAYERLLFDALDGDTTLFNRSDEIEETWKIIDPIIDLWRKENSENPGSSLPTYLAGSEGPAEANKLIWKDDFKWIPI